MIPRRMLGFGFALFLMLVILAVIYAQYAVQHQGNPAWAPMPTSDQLRQGSAASVAETAPLPAVVTPEMAADDLIDEALADRDDLSSIVEDEMADIEEGN